MMYLRIVLVFALAVVTTESLAQSRKEKKRKAETADQQPTSMDPSYPKKDYAPKASRKSSGKPTRELEEEYYERMENVQKEKRKSERLLSKPQYSDPLYFGHKRPPKKRKASKMKFCKECGIRH